MMATTTTRTDDEDEEKDEDDDDDNDDDDDDDDGHQKGYISRISGTPFYPQVVPSMVNHGPKDGANPQGCWHNSICDDVTVAWRGTM